VPLISIVPGSSTPARRIAAERIDRPAVARRNDVDVAVQMHHRPARGSAALADDVHAWITGGVLGPPVGRDVLDREAAARQPIADQPRAWLVRFAGRVDRRHADQIDRKRHDLVGRALDFGDHAVGRFHAVYNS
jgi:hypothetical protein